MKPVPTILHVNGGDSRTNLLDDFLDSSSDDDDEASFAEDSLVEIGSRLNESFASLHDSHRSLALDDPSTNHSRSGGLVGNLRSSLAKAKQASIRHIKKQCSNRSLFSNTNASHHKFEEDDSTSNCGELLNREILVQEQQAIKSEAEDYEFVKDVTDLRKTLERQHSSSQQRKTNPCKSSDDPLQALSSHLRQRKDQTLNSLSSHMRQRSKRSVADDRSLGQAVSISDYSAVHIKASAGLISNGATSSTRNGAHSGRRGRLSRSKSDPSQIEQMVHGISSTKGPNNAPGEAAFRSSFNTRRRGIRRHRSANAQDLLRFHAGRNASGCDSSQVSDLTLDIDSGSTADRRAPLPLRSRSEPRIVPLDITCGSFYDKKDGELASQCTSPTTELHFSEEDSEEEKAISPSQTGNEQQEAVGHCGIDRRHVMSLQKRKPSLRRVQPVELPNCSSHKGEVMGKIETDPDALVFEIDEEYPLMRSKHRGTSEFLQLNISNRSLAELLKTP